MSATFCSKFPVTVVFTTLPQSPVFKQWNPSNKSLLRVSLCNAAKWGAALSWSRQPTFLPYCIKTPRTQLSICLTPNRGCCWFSQQLTPGLWQISIPISFIRRTQNYLSFFNFKILVYFIAIKHIKVKCLLFCNSVMYLFI